tara:strand:- start:660 stop:1178 length:519 start_codon:yes stop_codon:yes gene_type:complete
MRDELEIARVRCSAFLEAQEKIDACHTVTPSELAEFLVREKQLSPEDAERVSAEVIDSLQVTVETRVSADPSPADALESFPSVITRFGEEWSLADETETLALYDCFNQPSGTHRGQVVLIKRWTERERKFPSGAVQKAGSAILPATDDFGRYAWNYQGKTAGGQRFDELKAE